MLQNVHDAVATYYPTLQLDKQLENNRCSTWPVLHTAIVSSAMMQYVADILLDSCQRIHLAPTIGWMLC